MGEALRVAVCEDSPEDMEKLISYLTKSNLPVNCDRFSSGESFLTSFFPGKYELVILDIYMDGLRGVDVAMKIREVDRTVLLVFTTTSPEHALESYRMRAVAYLEKPINGSDIQEVLTLAQAKRSSSAYITLLIDGVNKSIPTESILFFEHERHAITVHTLSGIIRTSQTVKLDHIEPLLPDSYLRCHHSYIVNLRYIKEIDRELSVFIMQDDGRVHIRRKDLKKALLAYEDFLFANTREDNR